MFITDIGLQTFSKANNFCSTVLIKLPALLNDTAVTELLSTEPDINHITKVDSYLKHKFKLEFTAYSILKIVQQLINITELFFTI